MNIINEVIYIFNYLLKLSSILVVFIVFYRFLTTNKTRIYHHRLLRRWLLYVHKISWFKLIKNASFKILNILNKLYGTPNNPLNILSNSYFNQRVWKVSFTVSLFYIVIFLTLIPYIYLDNNKYFITSLVLIFGFILFLILIYLVKLKFKNHLYKNSLISLNIILTISIFYNINIINTEFLFLIILFLLPIAFVWQFGISGLLSFFLSIFLYVATISNIGFFIYNMSKLHVSDKNQANIIEKNETKQPNPINYTLDTNITDTNVVNQNFSNSDKKLLITNKEQSYDDEISPFLYINLFFIFFVSLLIYFFEKKNYKYSTILKYYAIVTFFIPPISIYPIYGLIGLKIYFYTIFYILYFWFLIWGIVVANSVADMTSSNISRWLFYKIQTYHKWKEILKAIFYDFFIGSSLIFLTAGLLTLMFLSTQIIFDTDSPLNLIDFVQLINKKPTISNTDAVIIEYMNLINIPYIIGVINYSLYSLINFDINSNLPAIGEITTNDIKHVLWFFYCSVLIPTILHFIYIILLFLTKIISAIIQKPALYTHKLLIEKNATEDFFGKAFSGSSRAIIIISILLLVFTFFIIYISKYFLQ